MKSKGQVTIFIILGIVLLVIVGTSLYVTSLSEVNEDSLGFVDESVPDEVLPFKRFVEACTEDLLYDALKKAGASGGEIYYSDFGRVFNYFDPASSDGIEMFLGGDMNVPYWIYMEGDCSEGCSKTYKIPALVGDEITSIQSQVERYIEDNLDKCLRSSSELEYQDIFYEENGFPEAEVTFSDADVVASLDYPFLITTQGDSYEISKFRAVNNIPFKEYYDSAIYIATMADSVNLFEKATIQWISLYSYMDNDALPPKAGTDLEYVSSLLWITSEVQDDLKNILAKNIPLFTVQSSRNYQPVESDSFFKSMYGNYILPGEDLEDYNVDFSYLDWNPQLTLNGGQNVIRPESANFDWFPFFGINRLRTMYTVAYPILVSIENPNENLGEGFSFNFGLEVNIKDNDLINESDGDFNYSVFDNPETSKTYLCDIENSEPVSFDLIDGATGEPLEDVIMNFVCGDETCPLGKTDETGSVNQAMPVCSGAVIQLMKPSYETLYLSVNPNIAAEEQFGNIVLEPYRMMNVSLKRHLYVKNLEGTSKFKSQFEENDWYLESNAIDPLQNEDVVIILERVYDTGRPTYLYSEDFVTFGAIGEDELSQIRLLPGTYTGTITSVTDFEENPLKLLPQERCEKILGGIDEECYMVPEEEISLGTYAGAGADFSEDSPRRIVIGRDEMYDNNEIVFKEIYVDIPGIPVDMRVIEDLEEMGSIDDLSSEYAKYLQPEFR